jgi:hypothetical protein
VWTPLALVIVAGALGVGAWAGWRTARDQPVVLRQLLVGGAVEVLLLAEVVVAAVRMGQGERPPEAGVFIGYLVTVLCILPLAALWAFAERTRWSSVVLLVACVTVVVLQYRLLALWGAA